MELDKQTEAQSEAIQPDKVVVTESETTEAKPQAEATEEHELYVDDSSDDQSTSHKTEMTRDQSYAAFQKKKKQSAKRKEELEAGAVREQKLQDELKQLKATISETAKGKAPTLEECDYDDAVHLEKMTEFVTKSVANKAKQGQSSQVDDKAEFYLFEKEQALTKLVPEYDKAKSNLLEALTGHGINPEAGMNYLSNIARQKKVDIAKVVVAMNKLPHILDDVLKAGNNDIEVADILEKAANKVKTRDKKRIDSKPEPELNNSGSVDNSTAATAKAFKTWQEKPTLANFALYQKANNQT